MSTSPARQLSNGSNNKRAGATKSSSKKKGRKSLLLVKPNLPKMKIIVKSTKTITFDESVDDYDSDDSGVSDEGQEEASDFNQGGNRIKQHKSKYSYSRASNVKAHQSPLVEVDNEEESSSVGSKPRHH